VHSWSIEGNGTIDGATNTATVTVVAGSSGTYTVTDNFTRNGCAGTCSKTITVNPNPTCSISNPGPFCGGTTNNHTNTVLPAGGTVVHSWSIEGSGTIDGATNAATVTVIAGSSGTYTVTDNFTRNGCAGTCSKTITVNPNPTCSISNPGPFCGGTTNSHTNTVLPAGGTVVHSWSIGGNGTIDGATNTATVMVIAGASGSYTVTDNFTRNGCAGTCSKTISVVAQPTVSAIYNPPGCSDLTFTIDIPNSVSGSSYRVTQGGEISPTYNQTKTGTGGTLNFSGLAVGGGFLVRVTTGSAGCTATTNCASSTNSCTSGASGLVATKPVQAGIVESFKIALDAPNADESSTMVKATPNPFTDRVRFDLMSAVSGSASLELFNTLGQKVATVYRGFVQAGITLQKEFNVPVSQRNTLIYVFTVGNQKSSGKLLKQK
jgi:hypothetical protein